MKGRIEIRPVRIDDLREIYILGHEFMDDQGSPFLPAWNESNLADVIARDLELSLVAVSKKRVTGFLIASIDETGGIRTAAIRWLCADQSKHAGTTTGLLEAFTATLSGRNIEKIIIALPESNSELIEYYRNFGFTDSKRFIIMENFLPKNT
jgi:hypothetical protein